MKKKIFALLAMVMVAMTASAKEGLELKVGTSEHGTIALTNAEGTAIETAAEGQTVTALLGKMNIEGLTNQRVSALLRQLVLDGKVIKTVEGKKSYFSVA